MEPPQKPGDFNRWPGHRRIIEPKNGKYPSSIPTVTGLPARPPSPSEEHGVNLFRREVHDYQSAQWLGTVSLVTSRVGWVLTSMLFAAALVLVLFMYLGSYTRSESVTGQIVPRAGLIRISAPLAGTVTSVLVEEGVEVSDGQILAHISVERDSYLGGRVGEAVAAELIEQKRGIEAELAALEARKARELTRLEARLESLSRQKRLAAEQVATRRQQHESARALVEQIAPIRSGGQLTAMQIHQFEAGVLESMAQLELAGLHLENVGLAIAEAQAERLELPARMAELSNDLGFRLSELTAAVARNAGERSVVVRAPHDGIVSGLTMRSGQSVTGGRHLLSIEPAGTEYVAELWVPARAIGRIEPGGRVAMRYDAFPYRQFGQQLGRIRLIGGRALHPEEVMDLAGLVTGEPVYRVIADLDNQYVKDGAQRRLLRSNMTLQAALRLDRRRLVELMGLTLPADGPEDGTVPATGGDA
jgi:membrane fusion protein